MQGGRSGPCFILSCQLAKAEIKMSDIVLNCRRVSFSMGRNRVRESVWRGSGCHSVTFIICASCNSCISMTCRIYITPVWTVITMKSLADALPLYFHTAHFLKATVASVILNLCSRVSTLSSLNVEPSVIIWSIWALTTRSILKLSPVPPAQTPLKCRWQTAE